MRPKHDVQLQQVGETKRRFTKTLLTSQNGLLEELPADPIRKLESSRHGDIFSSIHTTKQQSRLL